MKYKKKIYILLCLWFFSVPTIAQVTAQQKLEVVRNIIRRFSHRDDINLRLIPRKQGQLETFNQQVSNGKLTISANSPIALCHGYYDWIGVIFQQRLTVVRLALLHLLFSITIISML